MIGAGIVGLSVATHLLESFHEDIVVTVIGDKHSPDTTASDIAGGIVLAPIQENKERSRVWIKNSVERYREVYNAGDQSVSYVYGHFVKPSYDHEPIWFKDLVSNFTDTTVGDSEQARFCTFFINGTDYCSSLLHKIQVLGGVLVKKKIDSLSELGSFDIVINCTGLGARELACDVAVYPCKGLLVSVSAPWVKEFFNEAGTHDGRAYIFPRTNEVILGGRNEMHKEDLMIHNDEVEEVIQRCVTKMPSLKNAEVLKVSVGVRPMRMGGVRLERDETSLDGSLVIHNYGHGPYGVTLSWGCAMEVGDIVGGSFGLVKKRLLHSKL